MNCYTTLWGEGGKRKWVEQEINYINITKCCLYSVTFQHSLFLSIWICRSYIFIIGHTSFPSVIVLTSNVRKSYLMLFIQCQYNYRCMMSFLFCSNYNPISVCIIFIICQMTLVDEQGYFNKILDWDKQIFWFLTSKLTCNARLMNNLFSFKDLIVCDHDG